MELYRLIDYGVLGIILVVFIKLFKAQYSDYKNLIKEMNAERKEFYKSMQELVEQTTKALVDKNTSDYMLSKSIEQLIDLLREKDKL